MHGANKSTDGAIRQGEFESRASYSQLVSETIVGSVANHADCQPQAVKDAKRTVFKTTGKAPSAHGFFRLPCPETKAALEGRRVEEACGDRSRTRSRGLIVQCWGGQVRGW